MKCSEHYYKMPYSSNLNVISTYIKDKFKGKNVLRFIVPHSHKNYFHANILTEESTFDQGRDIFAFNKRKHHNQDKFNACFIIPTGIGCELGGHAGDATPALKLIASVCDKVVINTNVANASDLNEMPSNALYCEGSVVTELLMGTAGLSEVRANKILVLIDADSENKGMFKTAAINSVNAARSVLGIDADAAVMNAPLKMKGDIKGNKAYGEVGDMLPVYHALKYNDNPYDAVAVTSPIEVSKKLHNAYNTSNGDMINPWGASESMLTHFISQTFGVPSAHSPMMEDVETMVKDFGIVDERIAPEIVSLTYLYCILKGLHKAPKIIRDASLMDNNLVLSVPAISVLVIPDGVLGLPVLAALHQGIKVVAVKNKNSMINDLTRLPWAKGQFVQCENYLEAAGILGCFKAGLNLASVVRFSMRSSK